MEKFNYYVSQGDKLRAFAEIVPYMLEGTPRAAVRHYLPALFKHLENDEACCVKGETSRCYPYNHQQPKQRHRYHRHQRHSN